MTNFLRADLNHAKYHGGVFGRVRGTYRALKSFWQRGTRGYADTDLWSLDWYLADWLPSALKWYAAQKHSWPGPERGFPQPRDWEKAILQMAEGFEAAKKLMEMDYWDLKKTREENMVEYNKLKQQMDEGLALFAKNFLYLWD